MGDTGGTFSLRGILGTIFRRRGTARPVEAGKAPVQPAPVAERAPPAPVNVAGTEQNWLRVLRADELLQVVQADKALREIWRKSRLSQMVFERDCLAAIRRYAEFVQLLPASEAHHHAHVGGLLTHTIEMLLAALTWRNARMLPANAPIEVIDAQRDEWTMVVFYAALLHDIGKVLTDLRVTWRAKDLEAVRWPPLAGSLGEVSQGRAQAEYLVSFAPKVDRDYSAHSRTAVMLLHRMASPEALALLAREPGAFEGLNKYLSGQDRDSLLAQIVREADKASARRALASGSRARFATAQAAPLVDLLMQSLKAMLRTGTVLPLNRSGAAGWVYEGSVWFVAKRVADATRDWIRKHEPDEAVPGETKNDRLFDTWQEYGCIQTNPATGQAVWYVTVHGRASEAAADGIEDAKGAYKHSLTVLRFPLEKLYDDSSHYPPPMGGTIEIHEKRKPGAVDEDGDAASMGLEPNAAAHVEGETAAPSDDMREAAASDGVERNEAAAGRQGSPPNGRKRAGAGVPTTLKAPTFNKPKPAPRAEGNSRPSAGQPPVPHARPGTRESAAARAVRPDESHRDDELRRPVAAEEADYFLDSDDLANEAALNQAREHRQLAKATRVARGARGSMERVAQPLSTRPRSSAPATSPLELLAQARHAPVDRRMPARSASGVDSSADPLSALKLPVGGARPMLLAGATPRAVARSAEPASGSVDVGDPPAAPRPVVLEPHLPKLPKKENAEREPVASRVAMEFITWLQRALASREMKFNETGAAVHFVPEGMALVSPLIFKLYAATQVSEAEIADHAMQVQREVIKAGWHLAGPNRTNIISYQVVGRGGAAAGKLAAVVLIEPGRFVQPVPPSNPVLRLL